MSPWPTGWRYPIAAVLSLPGLVLGYVAAILLRPITGGWPRWREGAFEVRAFGWLGKRMSRRNWAAFTFGCTVFLWSMESLISVDVARHERRHVRQTLTYGPLQGVFYMMGLLMDGYTECALERDARAAE